MAAPAGVRSGRTHWRPPIRLPQRYLLPALICALVSVAGYFQATGINHLLESALMPELDLVLAQADRSDPSDLASASAVAHVSAQPIIKRNPFDSITGPLDAKPKGPEEAPKQTLDLSDPLGAPECDGVVVLATTESTDPEWSMAVVKGPGEPEGHVRRIGDSVAGRQIAYIGYNQRDLSPAVWFVNPTSLCQVALFDDEPPAKPKKKATKPKRSPRKRGRGPPPVPKEIAKKIQRVSATEFNVDRSAVDAILEQHAQLMKSARITPVKKGKEVVGIKLLRVKGNTLLGTLGFKHGDTLAKINGYDMTSPQKALQAYAKLRTASRIDVEIERGGKPMTVTYNIR